MAAPKFHTPRKEARTVSPIVRALFDDAKARKIHMTTIADEAGMSRVGLQYWKSGRTTPSIVNFEIAAGILGYRLELVKKDN